MAGIKLWRYVVRSQKGLGGWGIFLLDSSGFFATVSDFGNYAYHWNAHGREDFREFLCELDDDYLCSKLKPQKVLYERESVQAIREHLRQSAEDGSFTEDEACEEQELLEELEHSDDFQEWQKNTRISLPSELLVYGYSHDVRGFAKQVYPRFVQLLREDLEHARSVV